jgi:Neisseria PilC beta-propeller domain
MNFHTKTKLILLCLLPLLGLSSVQAAPIFIPEAINTHPTTLVQSIQPVGYVGAPVASGYNLSTTQTAYVIDYNSQEWIGNLHAYTMGTDGRVSTTDSWNTNSNTGAAGKIDAVNMTGTTWNATARNIVTMNGASKVSFVWGSLNATQQGQLGSDNVLKYIRGDKTNELPNGADYRARDSVLGDIIHSTPLHWQHDPVSIGATPLRTVFVGANDGMLHAIDAVNGTERFAYIPSMLIPKLSALSSATYQHKYYVDGQMAARRFTTVSGGTTTTQSILVGGLGGGGKGLYALDITNARSTEANAADSILWEKSNASVGFENLGHTYGTPVLVKLPDTAGTPVAIVANGYNGSNATAGGGGYQAYLYVINAVTGDRLAEFKAGTAGTATSPNGLSSPTVIDSNSDGKIDTAYAGDIDGTLWKFDLSSLTSASNASVTCVAASATMAVGGCKALYNTDDNDVITANNGQAITMAPGVKKHPKGGYMVTFVTGKLFDVDDENNGATHWANGIWDRPAAFDANNVMLPQTIAETPNPYGTAPNTIHVRTASNNLPNWNAGAANHKGWKVALPVGGERVVGDGAYVTGGVFLFLSSNPKINVDRTPPFENWWMQINALTGGDNGAIRFDLNGSSTFDTADQVQLVTNGTFISPVGRHMGGGVRSQLTAFTTSGFDIYLANYDKNGDPPPPAGTSGVDGGHFDVDIYYGALSNAAKATATITVGTTGQTSPFPATLGAITVDGVVVVPALTVTDIVNGTASSTNATTIKNKVTNGYTATVAGNVITLTAPFSGADFNTKTIAIADGSSQTLVPASAGSPGVVANTGTLVMTAVGQNKSISLQCGSTFIGRSAAFTSSNSGTASARLNDLYTSLNGTSVNGYTMTCSKSPNTTSPTSISCSIATPVGASCGVAGGAFTVDTDITTTTNTGPVAVGSPAVAAVAQSGWTNFKPALTVTAFSGGVDGVITGDTCTSCGSQGHVHQYDDKYNVTGVNYLASSTGIHNLQLAINGSTAFKVIAQNQYLNPAVKIHLNGSPGYVYNINQGYQSIQTFATAADLVDITSSAPLDNTKVPTYTLNTVNSLAINMPVDALTAKNWWGNGDVRAGLHPTKTGCVKSSAGSTDGNMYQPINPPADGANGPGTKGWLAPTNTPATATGVRHNGALVIQVIRANTPSNALEMNVAGRPNYGWRVKSALFSTYVLAEFTTFWHHPNGFCYGDADWTKTPRADASSSSEITKVAGSADPKIGNLGVGAPPSAGSSSVTNADGSVTTTTITYDVTGGGYTTLVVTIKDGVETSRTETHTGQGIDTGGAVDNSGIIGGGVVTPLEALGRVNWRELFNN